MLRQRVVTAVVLVAIMFAALAAPGRWPFALVSLVLFAAGAWEWGRLNAASNALAVAMALVFALVAIAIYAGGAEPARRGLHTTAHDRATPGSGSAARIMCRDGSR